MIEGTNSYTLGLTDEEFQEYAVELNGLNTISEVICNLEDRRKNVLSGGVNCIPLPFERFRSQLPGIEQGQYVIVTANQKTGKCFGKGTKVRMADNTIKNIEDIRVGEMVMSPNDEAPKRVEALGNGKEQLYRIHSEMRDDLIVNENHIMYLYKRPGCRRKARYYTMTVKELLEAKKNCKNFHDNYRMVASDECDFGIEEDLPIEPYFYGLWLGDGSTNGYDITTPEEQIIKYLRDYAGRLNMRLSVYSYNRSCYRYAIVRKSRKDTLCFKTILEGVTGWQKKHINRRYLNASIEDRYQLLAGIIDTDGYLNKNKTGYQISMQYESCIKDIQELARSLGLSTTSRTIYNKQYNKNYYELRINGKNCIKIPTRVKHCLPTVKNPLHFSFDIEPIGEGEYYGLTVGGDHLFLLEDYTVVHNSQLTDYLYLFSTLDYAFEHPERCSVHIIYFSLEEAVQKVIERYMSHLLYKLDNIRIAPTDLRSTSFDYPVSEEILEKLRSPEYQERLKFFEECVQFETEDTNPTGILRVCERYAKSVGKYNSHKIQSRSNSFKDVEVFDSYVPDDPNHYKIVIIDHIGLVDKEQGFKTKDAVDKMSEYFVKYLRNRYQFTCVAIQQQASESEGLEAIKQKKMLPTAATLGDSKYTARDADIVLGLFDPSKFGLSTWAGYKIQDVDGTGLKNYGRFLYVIANRNGEMGGICPLFFDGAVCNFEELPKPDDINGLTSYYTKAHTLKSYRQQQKLNSLTLTLFLKKLKHKLF